MRAGLQSDETPWYFSKGLFHRFRCRRQFLFQNHLARFIHNAVERPAISQIQTDRQLLFLANFLLECLHSDSLFHSRSPFGCAFERVDHWEHIVSRRSPAFSSHLRNGLTGRWESGPPTGLTRTWLQIAQEIETRF